MTSNTNPQRLFSNVTQINSCFGEGGALLMAKRRPRGPPRGPECSTHPPTPESPSKTKNQVSGHLGAGSRGNLQGISLTMGKRALYGQWAPESLPPKAPKRRHQVGRICLPRDVPVNPTSSQLGPLWGNKAASKPSARHGWNPPDLPLSDRNAYHLRSGNEKKHSP